jgi:hypothetical protein
LQLADGGECHGWWVVWWRELVSHAPNVTRGGRHGNH